MNGLLANAGDLLSDEPDSNALLFVCEGAITAASVASIRSNVLSRVSVKYIGGRGELLSFLKHMHLLPLQQPRAILVHDPNLSLLGGAIEEGGPRADRIMETLAVLCNAAEAAASTRRDAAAAAACGACKVSVSVSSSHAEGSPHELALLSHWLPASTTAAAERLFSTIPP